MAPRRTGASRGCLRKVQRHLPTAETYCILHVFWLAGALALGAFVMTGPAGPAFDDLVYMSKVKVFVAVPKSGCSNRFYFRKGFFVVATETESVFPLGIRSVKRRGIIFHEQTRVIGPMRVMTSGACFSLQGPLPALVRFQKSLYVFNGSRFGFQRLVVAAETKRPLGNMKQLRLIGNVRIMTIHATSGVSHGRVSG
jgi:hypothetical protein